jgi:tetrahydromethanopterin:alpha-L-glutamate ligase
VLEVNSMPAWNGLQEVSHVRISDHLVDAFLDAALPGARREGQEGA